MCLYEIWKQLQTLPVVTQKYSVCRKVFNNEDNTFVTVLWFPFRRITVFFFAGLAEDKQGSASILSRPRKTQLYK